MERAVSVSPEGESFPLPMEEDYSREFERLQVLAAEEREKGREIVVVVGIGFVGAVMAAVVADAEDGKGAPSKFVIGMQRPSVRSFWKIPLMNRGISPVTSEDPQVAALIRRGVMEKKTLTATYTYDALRLADVVVVDVQCDYIKESLGDVEEGNADMVELEKAFEVIGEKIPPEALVLIETTVAPGTTEQVAYPILHKAFRRRGISQEPTLYSAKTAMGRKYMTTYLSTTWLSFQTSWAKPRGRE